MKKMKTRYSKPSVIVIQTAPVALLNTSIHTTNSYKEGNAQTMAASRESNSSWDDEE